MRWFQKHKLPSNPDLVRLSTTKESAEDVNYSLYLREYGLYARKLVMRKHRLRDETTLAVAVQLHMRELGALLGAIKTNAFIFAVNNSEQDFWRYVVNDLPLSDVAEYHR